jgi:phosphoglycolate phosphatase-like HAD superfamily hydrolase
MSNKYIQIGVDGEKAYARKVSLDKLRKVDAVIFDCDGVLIDIRESYNRAISETVSYIVEELTGFRLPQNMIPREIIYLFKKSGGFNNDWDLAYAALMLILCGLPDEFQEVFEKNVNISESEGDLLKRFLSVKKGVRRKYNPKGLGNAITKLENTLKQLAKACDASGIASIESKIINLPNAPKSSQKFYATAKSFLLYPGDVGESILTTVFEEKFCGSILFKETYGREPKFYRGKGLIENERAIIQPQTLNQLEFMFGKMNFGIASGRSLKLGEYALNELLGKFNSKALIFFGGTEAVNLSKPNPFSLLKSSEGLKPFNYVLYVGDAMEDALMVKEANGTNPCFLFAGVYAYSDCKDDVVHGFLAGEADVILPSVNELPLILKTVKGGKCRENS